jgi:hypothetical protein
MDEHSTQRKGMEENPTSHERSLANFDCSEHGINLDGPSVTVIVHRDIKADEELLRCYGDEWISMKHCHFHSNWLKRRSDATSREGSGQTHVMFVAEVEGHIQPCFRWVTDEESLPDIAGRLSLMKEKSMTALPIDELKALASLLGMLGLEKFGKGNTMFDIAWKSNVTRLKTENKRG